MSGRMPSPRRARRPAAKSAPMKRVRQGASAANSAKRASAAGSRSIAISVPSGPSRSATRRAWPPPPKVQSTAVCPGSGASSEISSGARTGTCSLGIIDQGCADRRSAAGRGWAIRSACSLMITRLRAAARPSAISGAAASSSSSCLAQASAFQISRYSPAPITTQLPSRPACSISGLGTRMRPAESSFSSKEPPWKRRRSWRASLPEGAVRARGSGRRAARTPRSCAPRRRGRSPWRERFRRRARRGTGREP